MSSRRVIQGALLSLATMATLVMLWAGGGDIAPEPGLVAEGTPPLYLKVYNSQEINSEAALVAYVQRRRAALQRIAQQDPNRTIEVEVSPSDYLRLADAWRIRDAYGLLLDSLTLDYWVGQNQGTMHVDASTVNVRGSLDEFRAALARVAPALPPGAATKDSPEPRLLGLRGRLPAGEALTLDREPAILAVDPTTDLLAPYLGRALRVEMVQMPQLLVARLRIAGQGVR